MDMLPAFHIKKPDVVHETIDGETVIVNLENGVYYSLRDSAVDIWNMIEGGANAEELLGMLLSRYEGSREDMQKAVVNLLVNLQQEGLVRVSTTRATSDTGASAPVSGPKTAFVQPRLEKYSDMQELLLLDPIHEVDQDGWPNKAEGDVRGDARHE
jgi:hypothetical protein